MKKTLSVAAAGIVLAAIPLLSACAGSPGDPIASARELADVPGWVSTPTGTDCGSVELGQQRTLPKKNLKCLMDASRAGDVGMLTWIQRTTEGDPVPSFVMTAGSGATVASTAAYDTYGQGGWTEYECTDIAALPNCSDGSQ